MRDASSSAVSCGLPTRVSRALQRLQASSPVASVQEERSTCGRETSGERCRSAEMVELAPLKGSLAALTASACERASFAVCLSEPSSACLVWLLAASTVLRVERVEEGESLELERGLIEYLFERVRGVLLQEVEEHLKLSKRRGRNPALAPREFAPNSFRTCPFKSEFTNINSKRNKIVCDN